MSQAGDKLVLLHVVHDPNNIFSTSQHVGSLLRGRDVVLPADPSLHQSGAQLEVCACNLDDSRCKNASNVALRLLPCSRSGTEHSWLLLAPICKVHKGFNQPRLKTAGIQRASLFKPHVQTPRVQCMP